MFWKFWGFFGKKLQVSEVQISKNFRKSFLKNAIKDIFSDVLSIFNKISKLYDSSWERKTCSLVNYIQTTPNIKCVKLSHESAHYLTQSHEKSASQLLCLKTYPRFSTWWADSACPYEIGQWNIGCSDRIIRMSGQTCPKMTIIRQSDTFSKPTEPKYSKNFRVLENSRTVA